MAIFAPCGSNKRVEDGRFAPFWHFCSHFLDVEGNGEEGKVSNTAAVQAVSKLAKSADGARVGFELTK